MQCSGFAGTATVGSANAAPPAVRMHDFISGAAPTVGTNEVQKGRLDHRDRHARIGGDPHRGARYLNQVQAQRPLLE